MAGTSRILAHIISIGRSTGVPDTDAEFTIMYQCTGPVSGVPLGQVIVQADITVAEAQIVNALQTAVANAVNPLITPPQSYTQSDVRGCNI